MLPLCVRDWQVEFVGEKDFSGEAAAMGLKGYLLDTSSSLRERVQCFKGPSVWQSAFDRHLVTANSGFLFAP